MPGSTVTIEWPKPCWHRRDLALEDVHGLLLGGGVQGGADGEAAAVEQLATLLVGGREVRVVQQRARHVVAEEAAGAGVGAARPHVLDVQHVLDGLLGVLVELLVGDIALAAHVGEHLVAALLARLGVGDRVVLVGTVGDARQECGLAGVELRGALGEVVLGAGLHAVLRGAELRDVEVGVEDLVLAPLLLEGDGELRLAQLAAVALLGRGELILLVAALHGVHEQRVLHVLLGERRAALRRAARGVRGEGADQALGVHAAVLEEAAVLDRDHRVLHVGRDLLDRHHDAVLGVEGRQQRPVGRFDAAGLVQRFDLELARVRVEQVHPSLATAELAETSGRKNAASSTRRARRRRAAPAAGKTVCSRATGRERPEVGADVVRAMVTQYGEPGDGGQRHATSGIFTNPMRGRDRRRAARGESPGLACLAVSRVRRTPVLHCGDRLHTVRGMYGSTSIRDLGRGLE